MVGSKAVLRKATINTRRPRHHVKVETRSSQIVTAKTNLFHSRFHGSCRPSSHNTYLVSVQGEGHHVWLADHLRRGLEISQSNYSLCMACVII